jgi:hypothetical protein
MTRPALPRTPDRFATWLRTTDTSEAWVGWRGEACGCPLAQYLISQGADRPSVGPYGYWSHGEKIRATPRWARIFLDALDRQNCHEAFVTATEALAILADLTPPNKETPHAS